VYFFSTELQDKKDKSGPKRSKVSVNFSVSGQFLDVYACLMLIQGSFIFLQFFASFFIQFFREKINYYERTKLPSNPFVRPKQKLSGLDVFHLKMLHETCCGDGWCWFVLREEYCCLVAGGWFVVGEKYCWLVADKPSEQG
jgi:hypothetical protein